MAELCHMSERDRGKESYPPDAADHLIPNSDRPDFGTDDRKAAEEITEMPFVPGVLGVSHNRNALACNAQVRRRWRAINGGKAGFTNP